MNVKDYIPGALPSPSDERDYKISRCMDIPTCGVEEVIPATFECWIPSKRYNQGSTGSCTAFAMATIFSCIWHKLTGEERDFSTGYIYTNTLETDFKYRGAYMRDVVKTVHKHGDILSVIGDNNDEKPESIKWFEENYPKFKEYSKMLVDSYVRLETKQEAMAFMYKYKIPLFVSLKMGNITPFTSNKNGLHAVAAYKYGRMSGFDCKNSWGNEIPFITKKDFDIFEEVWGIVPKENITFTDVITEGEDARWSADDIMEAATDGIVEGFPDNMFRPGEPVTREQIAVIWGRMKRYMDEHYTRTDEIGNK